ncbi:hypothetical protein [Embleya sp. MST-111070]|uniref:hypothetical protein n=1 Tax=Embleya sp. MST-111070 TaxID=3398231 RepID=UPI003F736C8F
MSSSAGTQRIDQAGIAERYGERAQTVEAWTRLLNFPAAVGPGEWDPVKVDAWVRGNRPQSWPGKPQGETIVARRANPPADDRVQALGQETPPSEPAPRPGVRPSIEQGETLGLKDLALRYTVHESAAKAWSERPGFPAKVTGRRWDANEVDVWVKKHRPHRTENRRYQAPKPRVVNEPPAGDPDDLLDLSEFGEILGNVQGEEPVPRTTMASYMYRGQIPGPDRVPGDRKRPVVPELMWTRKTINDYVLKREFPWQQSQT